jgi:flagellar M-ring protein FliF
MSEAAKLFKDIGPVKLGAMALVAIIIFAAIIFLSSSLSKPSVVALYSGLDSGDSAKIAAKLETMGIYYELRSGGAQIMVPRDKVLSVRLGMAEDGLPSGRANIGYEIFDKSDTMGTSSFVNNVNLIRALEGELGRTISAFEHIDSARVHLVMPKQDLFSKTKAEPTASVILKMRGNQPLEPSQIVAISHLVATAVPDLSTKRITIVDTQGRPFKKGGSEGDDSGIIASTNEEFRVQYEVRIKNTIEDLLSRSVGVGQVEAQVSADVDFDREIIDSEKFDPDGRVARSIQTTEEKGSANEGMPGGNVSAENNVPGGEAEKSAAASASKTERVDEITNYEVSKTVTKQVKETGTIKRLSIAVLVDGTYTVDEATEVRTYVPRADEELKKIETLVKSAVGFDEKRGDVIQVLSMQFSNEVQGVVKEKKFAWLTRDLGSIIQTLVIGIVITLVMLLIVRPMVGRAFEITKNENDEAELQAALAGQDLDELAEITGQEEQAKKKESLIDIDRFEERMNASSIGAINDIVDRHAEEAVTIIRGWMESDA